MVGTCIRLWNEISLHPLMTVVYTVLYVLLVQVLVMRWAT